MRRHLIAFVALLSILSPAAKAANSTVSAMTAASALAGTELLYCVQSAADRKCTPVQLSAYVFGLVSGSLSCTGLGACTVVTNANLTGDTTSVGNATTTTKINGVDQTTAWGSFSPTLTCGTGTLTTASATGNFKQIGKTVFYRFAISITTNGSCAASLRITLPVAPLAGVDMMTPVRDVGTSVVGAGRINSGLGNLLLITLYNGGYLGGDAALIVGTGVYEAN